MNLLATGVKFGHELPIKLFMCPTGKSIGAATLKSCQNFIPGRSPARLSQTPAIIQIEADLNAGQLFLQATNE
jgi:hypothetical protein